MATLSAAMPTAPMPEIDDDRRQFLAWRDHGDQAALRDLIERLTPVLWHLARRITGHDPDAEDAIQHGLLQMVTRAHSYAGRGSCRAWILAVVANAARKHRRALQRRRAAEARAAAGERSPAAPSAGPEREDVEALVAQLPTHEREALCLHLMDGWSVAEVAAGLGSSVHTVRSRVRRGLARLRAQARQRGWASEGPSLALLASLRLVAPPSLPRRLAETLAQANPRLATHPWWRSRAAHTLAVASTLAVVGWLAWPASRASAPGSAVSLSRRAPAQPPVAVAVTGGAGLTEILGTPVRIALRHATVDEALRGLGGRLPIGMVLPCSYPADVEADAAGISWSTGGQPQRVRRILDALADATGLQWQVVHDQILFVRHLSPTAHAQWSQLLAAYAQPGLTEAQSDMLAQRLTAIPHAADDPQALQELALLVLDRTRPPHARPMRNGCASWLTDHESQSTCGRGQGPLAAMDPAPLRPLIAAALAGSPDEPDYLVAVELAGQLRDEAVVPALVARLASLPPSPSPRQFGMIVDRSGRSPFIHALMRIGGPRVAAAWPALLATTTPTEDLCIAAGTSGDPALLASFTQLLQRPDWVRCPFGNPACTALMMLPESAVGTMARQWITTSDDASQVAAAAGALAAWGHATDRALLVRRLEDPHRPAVATGDLITAIGRCGDARTVPVLLRAASHLQEHPIAQRGPWPLDVGETVAQALAALPAAAEPALARQAMVLEDPLRLTLIAHALATSLDPDALPDLRRALEARPAGPLRDALLGGAAVSQDADAEALAIAAMRRPGSTTALMRSLAHALEESRVPATREALLALLGDPATPVPVALAVLAFPPHVEEARLTGVLDRVIRRDDVQPQVRGAALLALPRAARAAREGVLAHLLAHDAAAYVRACAVAVLPGDAASGGARDAIRALAHDASPLVRRFAAARLVDTLFDGAAHDAAVAALERALTDPDPGVRITAAQALSEQVCCAAPPIQAAVRDCLVRQAAHEANPQVQAAFARAVQGEAPARDATAGPAHVIGSEGYMNFGGASWQTPLYAPVFEDDPAAAPSSPFGHG